MASSQQHASRQNAAALTSTTCWQKSKRQDLKILPLVESPNQLHTKE